MWNWYKDYRDPPRSPQSPIAQALWRLTSDLMVVSFVWQLPLLQWVLPVKVQFLKESQRFSPVMSNSLQPHGLQQAQQASLSITSSLSLLKLMSIKSVISSNHLILCHPLLLLPSIFPSIKVFSNESALHIRWPKYWSFSFNISPSNEYSGRISFRMDWLDLLAVQGTLKSLLQQHSSKASFFGAQLSLQSKSYIHTWPLEKP